MKKNKKFYRACCRHLWLLIATLIFVAIYSIIVWSNPKALVWGIGAFFGGLMLMYVAIKLAPIGQPKSVLSVYLWGWRICILLITALFIFWGLYIPHHAKTYLIVIGILAWVIPLWFTGSFFICSSHAIEQMD